MNILPESSASYWQKSVSLMSYPTLNDNVKCDVGVVGAGITGITTALLLAEQGYSVCLFDAGNVLSGTTSLTTGKITAQHGLMYANMIEQFGLDKTKQYYEANETAKTFIEETIHRHSINQRRCIYLYRIK